MTDSVPPPAAQPEPTPAATPAPAPAPPAPAPAAAAAPAPATGEKWNILSIVAFVIVFFGFSLISIILGFIALNQIKKTGERGRGLAIWAIVLGFVSIIIGIIFWIVFATALMANSTVTVN
ncbi:DUF4190 domain-containing protein [Agromyces sp. NPDC057865]|uniref:DUF4190 domain-containing protein n=1 Tax=Agromyces sp. NPDC057865 TaxID=3346267 RepID=UPI0036729ABA